MKTSTQNQSNQTLKTKVFVMQARRSNRSNLPLLMLALAISVFFTGATFAASDTWTGGASPNGNWNVAGNWLAGIAPSPYDSLIFTNQTGSAKTATNDFAAGTAFDGITFGASAAGSPFKLVGNSILLSGNTNIVTIGITNSTSLAETVSNNLILDWGYHTFYSPAAGSSLNLNGTMVPNLGSVANFGTSNVNSTAYVQDGTGLIAGLGGAGLVGNASASANGGFTGLATVSNGVVTDITMTNAGSGYTNPPTVAIDPPDGLLIGETNSILTLHSITTSNIGNYFVVINNSVFGTVTSSVASLTIAYQPSLTLT